MVDREISFSILLCFFTQGMSYVAAMLHLHMATPFDTFVCLANLLDRDLFQSLYAMNPMHMARHIDAFEALLRRSLPRLAAHFERENVRTDYYLLDWCVEKR